MIDDALVASIHDFTAQVAGGKVPTLRSWSNDLQWRARQALLQAGVPTDSQLASDRRSSVHPVRVSKPETDSNSLGSPAVPSDAPHVFLCYPSEYRDEVRQVAAFLEAAGVPVWYDVKLLAERWDLTVERRIRSCSVLVLLVGPRVRQAERTEHIASEVGLAQSLGKPVLPVLLSENRDLPEGLGLKIVNLARVHCTNLADPEFQLELTERLRPYISDRGLKQGRETR